MLINLRNALMAGKKRVTFIEWLASDGTGYVDLQYAPTDPETRMLITASTSTDASNYAPLVCAGMNTAMNDVSKTSFGFASINNDRQIYLKSARQHWWNLTANAGNWDDGNFHSIDIGQSGATSSTCSVDGLSISMQRISNSTSGLMPTDTQTVFASKYNGDYYLKNSKFKVARIAYEVGGVIVHDFVAAKVGETCGFYDITTSKFIAGVGGLVAGPEIHAVEYIESHGTEYIDTGYKFTSGLSIDLKAKATTFSQFEAIFGAFATNDVGNRAVIRWVYQNDIQIAWFSTSSYRPTNLSYNSEITVSVSPTGGVLNGTSFALTRSGVTLPTTQNCWLFAASNDGTARKWNGRCSYCNMTDNSTPVRKFRSVRVGTEGAMMDTLTRRIYRNAGTGAFTYGNDLKYPIPAS